MAKPDLTYSCNDGYWTCFYPETEAGENAWRIMAEADENGVVAFAPWQVKDVLAQLRAAGYTVRKAKPHKPLTDTQLDELLAELCE